MRKVGAAVWRALWQGSARALLSLLYPETCALCGSPDSGQGWTPVGPQVMGLTWADGPHLCVKCLERLAPAVQVRPASAGRPAVHASCLTGPEIVRVLAAFKYHGVRGLAWPLGGLLATALASALRHDGTVAYLVPVALHRRRQRERGFNQSELLARVAAVTAADESAVVPDLLRRVRATGQQAKLATDAARKLNVAGAFVAGRRPLPGEDNRLGLVDDLVTGGATAAAAASALTAAGWEVRWIAAVGLAGHDRQGA